MSKTPWHAMASSIAPSTTLICALLIFGCAAPQLPPAVPEDPTVFALPTDTPPDSWPLVTPPAAMLDARPQPPSYTHLRTRVRQRLSHPPRPGTVRLTAEVTATPQLVAFPPAPAVHALPRPQMPQGLSPSEEPFLLPRTPARPVKPERLIAESNAANLMTPRVKGEGSLVRYPYSEEKLYLVLTSPEHPTLLYLQPGEKRTVPLLVDPAKFQVDYTVQGEGERAVPVIAIRPTDAGYKATTAIISQSRTYYLRLESTASTSMLAVKWLISQATLEDTSQDEPQAPGETDDSPQVPGLPPFDLRRLHTGYTVVQTKGTPSWVPVSVFDDGRRTVLKFKMSLGYTNAPAVFVVRANGEPGVVEWTPYEVPDQPDLPSYYVVAGIWPRLVLKGVDGQQVTITRTAVRTATYQPVK